MNYYEHHIGDYAEATAHLSFAEDAAYSRMIRKYYSTEKPLPCDIVVVQRLVGARSKEEKDAVEAMLREFFELREDGWHQPRCDEELERFHAGDSDREIRRQNEKERQRRSRERRKVLFDALRSHGIIPDFDTPTSALEAQLSRVTDRDGHSDVTTLSRVTSRVRTAIDTVSQTPDSRLQSPDTSLQSPGLRTVASVSVGLDIASSKPPENDLFVESEHSTANGSNPGEIEIPSGAVDRVFVHWQSVHDYKTAKLDPKRRKLIREALKLYGEDDLCRSLSGYKNSPHHMGQNDRNTVYNSIELLLKDAKRIDAGLRFFDSPPRTDLSAQTRRIIDQTADWVPPEMRNAGK